MAKATLLNDPLYSITNTNNDRIEAAIENTLSRDGTSPNEMEANLDMNSYRIINLPDAVGNQEPVTLSQAATIAGVTNPLTKETVGAVLYPRTSAEVSASITPTNYYYPQGDVRRYGNGTQAAIQAALTVGGDVWIDGATYTLTTNPLTVSSDTTIYCNRDAVINQSTTGQPAIKGSDVSNVTIIGGTWTAANNTTAIDSGNGGVIYIDNRGAANGNVRIFDTKVSQSGTAGIAVLNASSLWIERNEVSDCADYGILASRSSNFHIDSNYIHDSAETGAANTYGIMATGDDNGGDTSERCSISNNKILNIASWDGIMSHDVTKLVVSGNIIENVRTGIDIGHVASTNVIKEVLVSNNVIRLTSTDNWGGAGAVHGGILIVGHSSTPITSAVVVGNIVSNVFNISGATISGDAAGITIEYCKFSSVSGNNIYDIGSIGNRVGIYLVGTLTVCTVSGNVVEGDAASGGIRTGSVTTSALAITGNSVMLDTTSDTAILIGSGTYNNLTIVGNATNSTLPYDVTGGPTITVSGRSRMNGLILDGATPVNTVSAGQIGLGLTTDTTATNGTGEAMKANVEGYLEVNVAGTIRKIPFVKD